MRTVVASLAICLIVIASAGAWAAYRLSSSPVPWTSWQRWTLVTTMDPSLLAVTEALPSSTGQDSVTWLDQSELLLERRWVTTDPSFESILRLWIRFSPPDAPRIAVVTMTENKAIDQQWGFYDVEGRAWISSDGQGLGSEAGPGLAIRWEFQGKNAGSLDHDEGSALLTRDQLRRKE